MNKIKELMYKIKSNEATVIDYEAYAELTNVNFPGEVDKVIHRKFDNVFIMDFDDFILKRKHPLNKEERRILEAEVTGSLLGVGDAALTLNPKL